MAIAENWEKQIRWSLKAVSDMLQKQCHNPRSGFGILIVSGTSSHIFGAGEEKAFTTKKYSIHFLLF